MQTIATIGFGIAKTVFQVHGIDAAGDVGGYPPLVEAALCPGVFSSSCPRA
jgi:hypothetical protein